MTDCSHAPICTMQQNCRVSKDIALTLINDVDPAKADLILLQEPYVYPNTKLTIASPKWHAIYPLGCPSHEIGRAHV